MKKIHVSILLAIFCSMTLVMNAQTVSTNNQIDTVVNGVNVQAEADSLVSSVVATVDSTLIGRSVMSLITSGSSSVEVSRTAQVDVAFDKYLKNNSDKKINGYRIRIFFDNKQTARVQSEELEKRFIETYPQYPVYRTYTNPYFKVAVGDCRTKSDAARLLREIQIEFPNAFIIRDVINYPL